MRFYTINQKECRILIKSGADLELEEDFEGKLCSKFLFTFKTQTYLKFIKLTRNSQLLGHMLF